MVKTLTVVSGYSSGIGAEINIGLSDVKTVCWEWISHQIAPDSKRMLRDIKCDDYEIEVIVNSIFF